MLSYVPSVMCLRLFIVVELHVHCLPNSLHVSMIRVSSLHQVSLLNTFWGL